MESDTNFYWAGRDIAGISSCLPICQPAEASGFRSFAKAKKTEVPDSSEDESDSSGKGKTTDPVGPQQDDLAVRLCKPMEPIIYG